MEMKEYIAEFKKSAEALYNFSDNPAVKYKIQFSFFGLDYDDAQLCGLRDEFLSSDIVCQLSREQGIHGDWGKMFSKDYSLKTVFPTTAVAVERCLYIGLTLKDRDILINALNFMEDYLHGRSAEKMRFSNERVKPWCTADICNLIEAVNPRHPDCDGCYDEWIYIAQRAFAGGEYSYDREARAQHEVFGTREARLVPMCCALLVKRREELGGDLEDAMLRHYGEHVYNHGHFWDKTPAVLPSEFTNGKMRRWFHSFNYINMFRGSELYLKDSVDWLLGNRSLDSLWDFGPQVKDPWGYFGNFSTRRGNPHDRKVDCSMEILNFLSKYITNNI